jgi:uncharacterized membrane protein YraQ (UPF0718 family)
VISSTVILLIELATLFFSVAFLVQLAQRRIGPERLRQWMGGKPLVAALKGITVGFITPFCTYSAVPMLIGMRQAGVPTAGFVAFIMAAPVLDPVLFGALAIIVGINAAFVYLLVAFIAALTLALIADRIDITGQLKPIPVQLGSACAATDCGVTDRYTWQGGRIEIPAAATEAIALLRSVGPLLLIGVTIGIGVTVFLSIETVTKITASSLGFEIPLAAVIGIPIYTTTAVLVPIADSLQGVGVSIGAIVALTIAGSGANLPEFILLLRFFSARIISIFFLYVFFVAITGGYLAQALVG